MLKVAHRLQRILPVFVGALFFSVPFALLMGGGAVNAETVDYNVYVKPSLKISISSNPVVLNLNPNSRPFGTADVDVSVGTNNLYGYQLFMNTDSNATSLERDSTADSITASIPTLSNGGSTTPCNSSYTSSTFTANSWGYRINNNVGGASNCIDTTNTNYYSYTPGTMISSSTTATNEQTANLTFASKIDYDKPAGQYELTLKMKALPIVTTYYMQDIAASPTLASTVCTEEPTVVIDKRDEQAYTIRRIDGTCWMVENLQFTGTTMDSTTSNVAPEYTPANPYVATYYDLVDEGGSGGKCNNNSGGHIYSCIKEGDITVTRNPIKSTTPGTTISTVWYNYAAATAGSISGNSNTNPQLYDICPAGWKLPTLSENLNPILGATYVNDFNAHVGGVYLNSSYLDQNIGYWWSATTYDGTRRYDLAYRDATDQMTVSWNVGRFLGLNVRCVLRDTSTTLADVANMQDINPDIVRNTAVGTTKALTDVRDNKSYNVKKIADGNIWMTDNLLFQGTAMSPDTSDVTQNRYMNSATSPGTYTGYNLNDNAATSTDNCWGSYNSTTPTSSTGNGFTSACMYYISSDANIGNKPNAWYNYAAATAYTVKDAGSSTATTEATESICPKGWRLPSDTYSSNLISALGSNVAVFNPVYGGYFYDAPAYARYAASSRGYWWTSTATSAQFRSGMTNDSGTLAVGAYSRVNGFYIRCIAR